MKKKNTVYYSNQKNEKKIFNKWRKIFIFNFDPRNDEITEAFLSKKVRYLLQKYNYEILYIFVTKFNLNTILKTLNKILKPKTGYIISDNGACLYDIKNEKIIFESSLKQETKSALIHEGILKSLLILSGSVTKCFSYSEDINKYKEFMRNFNIDNKIIENYLTFYHYIYENEFRSFIFYESNTIVLLKKYKILKSLENDFNINFSSIENNMFCVSNNDSSILKTYLKVLELLEDTINNEKTYYFVLNSFDNVLWNIFSKNHYMNISYSVSNHNFLKMQVNPKDLFLAKNIIKIISTSINKPTFNKIHSILNIEKEFVDLENKNH